MSDRSKCFIQTHEYFDGTNPSRGITFIHFSRISGFDGNRNIETYSECSDLFELHPGTQHLNGIVKSQIQ